MNQLIPYMLFPRVWLQAAVRAADCQLTGALNFPGDKTDPVTHGQLWAHSLCLLLIRAAEIKPPCVVWNVRSCSSLCPGLFCSDYLVIPKIQRIRNKSPTYLVKVEISL